MKLDDDININYRIGSPSEEWIKKEADGIHAMGYREGYKQAESDYKKKLDDIKAEILEKTECHYGNKCLGANCPSNTDCMIMGEHAIEIINRHTSRKEQSEC